MFTKICAFLLILTIPTCSIADILYFRSSKTRTCKILAISDSTFLIQDNKRAYNKRRPAALERISAGEILAYKYKHGTLTPVTLQTSADSLAFDVLVEMGTPKIIKPPIGPIEMFFIGMMFYIAMLAVEEGRN